MATPRKYGRGLLSRTRQTLMAFQRIEGNEAAVSGVMSILHEMAEDIIDLQKKVKKLKKKLNEHLGEDDEDD